MSTVLDPETATPEQVFTKAGLKELTRTVRKGAALLDVMEPGWFRPSKVALSRLAMGSCEVCVLGQLYGDYMDGLNHLGIPEGEGYTAGGRFGFDLDDGVGELTRANISWADRADLHGDPVGDVAFDFLRDVWEDEIRTRRAFS